MTRRGLALIRVSKVGDRGEDLISPDIQRQAIIGYCVSRGIEVVDWVEALDESGSQQRSRWWSTLDAAIGRVEAENLDALLVYKFSRTARNRIRWAVALDRIETAGATLESASEGVDTSTATGRFTRGMLAEINAYEAERIGEGWKEVKARRTRLGLTGDGQYRFGYDVQQGLYTPGEHAETLRVAYEQRVAGMSMRTVVDGVTAAGGRTKYGNLYDPWHFGKVLRSGFGAGLLHTPQGWVEGCHEPVVSSDLWRQFLALPPPTAQRRRGKYPLSGLLRCAYCHHPLHSAYRVGCEPGTYWRCPQATPDCTGTYGWAPKIDRLLNAWLTDLLAGRNSDYQRLAKARPPSGSVRKQRRLLRIEQDLLVIARKNNEGFYDDQTYLRLRAELVDEQRMLLKELAGPEPLPVMDVVEAALQLEGAARGAALRKVLDCVLVSKGERDKYRIIPRWRG